MLSIMSFVCMAQISTDKLVGYYPMNGNFNDSLGKGFNGIAHGAITPCKDRFNKDNGAMEFHGTHATSTGALLQDYVTFGNDHWFDFSSIGRKTISMWQKITHDSSFVSVCRYNNFSFETTGGGHLGPSKTPGMRIIGKANGDTFNFKWRELDTGWIHIAIVMILGVNELKVYINGEHIITRNLEYWRLDDPQTDFELGRVLQNIYTYYSKGSIDDLFIYNRELTVAEIKNLYSPMTQIKNYTVLNSIKISNTNKSFDLLGRNFKYNQSKIYIYNSKIRSIYEYNMQ